MRTKKYHVGPSWIRSWFMRQEDYTLWCIAVVWVIAQIALAVSIVTVILKGIAS